MNAASELGPFQLGQFLVQPELRTLGDGESTIHLEPKVMNVLLVLADRAGHVVSRQEFYDRVWPNADIGDEVLSRCIYQLRSHFGDSSRAQRVILTVPKHGYKLLLVPSVSEQNPDDSTIDSGTRKRARWPVAVGMLGLGAAIAIYLSYRPELPQKSNTNNQPPAVEEAFTAPGIVVVPYSDLSKNSDKHYFTDGITEELLIGLGQIRGLRVFGRESAEKLLESAATPAEIGRILNVDAILTGSVQVDGNTLRVSNRLINTATGEQIWSESLEGATEDVFDMEDRITRTVVTQLEIKLIDDISKLQVRRVTENNHAYQLYAEGHYYLDKRDSGSLQQSIEFFEQAIAADPRFALAYSSLADANMLLSQYGEVSLSDATQLADASINKALTISPNLGEAHASRGLMLLHNSRYDEAAEVLRLAASLDPSYVPAHLWLGRALDLQAEFSLALAAYRRAHQLDPLSPIVNMNVGRMLMFGGRAKEADRYFDTGLKYAAEFANLHWARGHNEYLRGNLDAAVRSLSKAIDLGLTKEVQIHAVLSTINVDSGDFEAGEHFLRIAERINAESYWAIEARHWLMLAQERYAELGDYLVSTLEQLPARKELLFKTASLKVRSGDIEDALRLFEIGIERSGETYLYSFWDYAGGSLAALDLAYIHQQTGNTEEQSTLLDAIEAFMQQQEQRGLATPATHYVRAAWYAQKGDVDEAINELLICSSKGWSGLWTIQSDPRFDEVRESPRFAAELASAL
ncbi:MAG: winged helix-turn-helix domain-containing protein [Gammaproteobacteria bacterium]|nr:winged helix-turn-helix domain-containing protein [Gammaproteobacteria bacterium]